MAPHSSARCSGRRDLNLGVPLHVEVPIEDRWIATRRGTLFARSWKPARAPATATFLLFHDSLGCVELWRDFPEQLASATGLPVVAYDRLGFGQSDANEGPLAVTFTRDEANDVVPLLREALGLEMIIPFGHSVGGSMAVATAARWPEQCAGVITEAAQAFVESRTLEGIAAEHARFEQPGELRRLERYHGEKARWVLDSWYHTWFSPGFADWSIDADLRQVRCPTLAIHGDRDEYGSTAHPERIARLVQGQSTTVILAGCGHVPHREETARVLAEIDGFVAQIAASAPYEQERLSVSVTLPPGASTAVMSPPNA